METANFQHTWRRCPAGTLDINFNGGFRCVPVASAGSLPLGGKNGKSLFSKLRRTFHKALNGVGLGDTPNNASTRTSYATPSFSTSAYRSGYKVAYKRLQAALNSAAVKLGVEGMVPVNGIVDDVTAKMFDRVADQLTGQGLTTMLHVWERGSQAKDIADNADALTGELNSFVQYVQPSQPVPSASDAISTANTPTVTLVPPAPEAAAASAAVTPSVTVPGIPYKLPKWVPWAGGAVVAILAVKLLR